MLFVDEMIDGEVTVDLLCCLSHLIVDMADVVAHFLEDKFNLRLVG